MNHSMIYRMAGRWLVLKAREQQSAAGTYAAARNLRKQGVPLPMALAILARADFPRHLRAA